MPNAGQTNDWLTPPEIIRALGSFTLDPCCPAGMPWRTAHEMFTSGREDGLKEPWRGRVWLNPPPYGLEAAGWLERMTRHADGGTALIFARTETDMFFKYVWPVAQAVLFVKGRLHFHRLDGKRSKLNSGGPSVLVAYGETDSNLLECSGIAGKFIRLRD